MTNHIEFASPDGEQNNNPWAQPKSGSYQDLVLKEEYQARRLRFPLGPSWFRIVPALRQSVHGWMLPIHAVNHEEGRFAHPRTSKRNAKSVFDHAYSWYRENKPEQLFSKTNKNGVRLLTDPMCAFWAIIEEDGKPVARLFCGGAYDGSRGGTESLGHRIWRLTRDCDENGKPSGEAIHPEKGALVRVERTQARGAKYPSYQISLGRLPSPVDSLLEKMEPEEQQALCPLENVVRELTIDEEWKCLEKVIPADIIKQIRGSVIR